MKLEFVDIKRAYLQAPARRDTYVQHLEEESAPGMCAKLVKAMSGTLDAAHNWEWGYRTAHEGWGFIVGKASPCVMYHPERRTRVVVQGDHFAALGQGTDQDWYRNQLTSRFEAKVEREN